MNFFQTKLGKNFLLYFIIFFVTSLFCGLGYGESLCYAVTAVIFIIPITMIFGALIGFFNIKKLKKLSFEEGIGIIFVLLWIYIIILANTASEKHNKNHNPQPITTNYESHTSNYIPNVNMQPIYQKPISENIKTIDGLTYNIIPIEENESLYSTSPVFDSQSNGYLVTAIQPTTNKNITIAITSTNCSAFNKRMNNLSSLNPQIYMDRHLLYIFDTKEGIEFAKYICNYKK